MTRFYPAQLLFALIFAGGLIVSAAEPLEDGIEFQMRFREANQTLAEQKDYEKALETYQQLLDERGPSVNLLSNIANAYFKMGDYSRSRLYLERILLMDPGHPDVRKNYRLVLGKLGFEVPESHRFDRWVRSFSSDHWFLLAWTLLLIPFLWIMARVFSRRLKRRAMRFGGMDFFPPALLILPALSALYFAYATSTQARTGIVIAPQAVLRQSPFQKAEAQFNVNPGEKLRIIGRHERYFQCITQDGTGKGWIGVDQFEPVLPSEEPS